MDDRWSIVYKGTGYFALDALQRKLDGEIFEGDRKDLTVTWD